MEIYLNVNENVIVKIDPRRLTPRLTLFKLLDLKNKRISLWIAKHKNQITYLRKNISSMPLIFSVATFERTTFSIFSRKMWTKNFIFRQIVFYCIKAKDKEIWTCKNLGDLFPRVLLEEIIVIINFNWSRDCWEC